MLIKEQEAQTQMQKALKVIKAIR